MAAMLDYECLNSCWVNAHILDETKMYKIASCDLDPFPTRLLKHCIDDLIVPITAIINLSMREGVVPPDFKQALVTWDPYLRKDIDMLDKIQRRATKLIPGLRDLRYEERLKECGLTTVETRRLTGIK